MIDRHNRMCYEAHKFKQLVTTKGQGKRPDFKETVCVKPDFIGVFKGLEILFLMGVPFYFGIL